MSISFLTINPLPSGDYAVVHKIFPTSAKGKLTLAVSQQTTNTFKTKKMAEKHIKEAIQINNTRHFVPMNASVITTAPDNRENSAFSVFELQSNNVIVQKKSNLSRVASIAEANKIAQPNNFPVILSGMNRT